MMRVGIASDHGGFVLKGQLAQSLCTLECEIGLTVHMLQKVPF
jgi:hypothetical protein